MPRTVMLVLCFLAGASAFDRPVSAQQTSAEVLTRLTGNWRLVTWVNFDESGAARDSGYKDGRIVYDAGGNMSAHLMRADRKPLSQPATEAERAAAYSSYYAYYGKVTIDPSQSTVTHHVEGSVNPNWVKTDLVRYYELSPDGKRLMLSIKNAQGRVTGTLTWEKIH